MVILKSTNEEINRLLFLANTKLVSHIIHGLLYSDNCKNFPREMREAPHLLEYTMAANHGLLEEDGVF